MNGIVEQNVKVFDDVPRDCRRIRSQKTRGEGGFRNGYLVRCHTEECYDNIVST